MSSAGWSKISTRVHKDIVVAWEANTGAKWRIKARLRREEDSIVQSGVFLMSAFFLLFFF